MRSNLGISYKNFIYLELSSQSIFIGKVTQNKNIFKIWPFTYVKLKKTVFDDGVIYNPTIICSLIKNFVISQKLTHLWTIISVPDLTRKSGELLKCAVLQIALCAIKTQIKIFKIYSQALINISDINDTYAQDKIKNKALEFTPKALEPNSINLLKLIGQPRSYSLYFLFFLSCVILAGTVIGACYAYNFLNKNIIFLNNKRTLIKQDLLSQKREIKKLTGIKNKIETLQKTQAILTHIKINTHNPYNLFKLISEKIPSSVSVINININKKKKILVKKNNNSRQNCLISFTKKGIKQENKVSPYFIYIKGESKSLEGITKFIKSLNTEINTLILDYLEKNRKSKGYLFTLKAQFLSDK
jgi:hypothetical protein